MSENNNHVLSFVTSDPAGMVTIHADLAGIEHLISELEYLRKQLLQDDCPHTHLFQQETMDGMLTSTKLEKQSAEQTIVSHVKIYGWNEEWARKHGLKQKTQ